MVNISSPSFSPAVVVSFLIIQVTPLLQADADDQLYFTGITPVIFGCINYALTYVGLGLQFPRFKLLGDCDLPGLARPSPNDISIYIETAIVVVISFVLLLQVNSSYVWLAVFPIITIGFILALSNELSRQQNGSQQRGAGSGGDLVGGGKEMKKAEEEEEEEEEEHDGEAASSSGSGGDPGAGKEMKKAEGLEVATLVVYWVLCIMGQFQSAANFAVSLFLLFLSFTLGALTRMMTQLSLTRTAPGGAPASALLRKASLVVLLVAVHAVAVELLGEQVVLFILPEFAPLLLWLTVHVDRAKEGAIVITADHTTFSRNLAGAVAVVVLACLAAVAAMDESIFSWVAKAVVSCGVSGLLVCYLVFMISQWQGQDAAKAAPFLEETVKLLKVWAKVLQITAIALLVPTFVAALHLDLHVQMLAAPAESFNKYVTSSSTL